MFNPAKCLWRSLISSALPQDHPVMIISIASVLFLRKKENSGIVQNYFPIDLQLQFTGSFICEMHVTQLVFVSNESALDSKTVYISTRTFNNPLLERNAEPGLDWRMWRQHANADAIAWVKSDPTGVVVSTLWPALQRRNPMYQVGK